MVTQNWCDHCGRDAMTLTAVMVGRQTHSEPAEWEEWCAQCLGHPEQDEERASLRGYSDEDLERV